MRNRIASLAALGFLFAAACSSSTPDQMLAPQASSHSVTVNPDGTGFVGKGDVQIAFGWSNAVLQNNAPGVTFGLATRDTYDVTCEWTTETGGPSSKTVYHDVTVPKHTGIESSLNGEPRPGPHQFTGFNLTGWGAVVIDGTVPVVGDACPGNNPGLITDVTLTGSTGGYYAEFGGVRNTIAPL